jgi:predicted branched-subunit amino acid permease
MVADRGSDAITFTLAGVRRGAVAAQAISVSILVYGVAFGLMARQAGLSIGEATLTSGFVYSGSAQLAAVTTIAAGQATAVTLAATILVMNARYLLFGAALRPWLGHTSAAQAYSSLFFLGDGNWILSMRAHAEGERDAGYVLGSGLPMFLAWLLGTVLGSWAGAILTDPKLLGLDFMLAAFAAAMMVGMTKARTDFGPLLAGAGAAWLVNLVASFGWAIVAAGLAGGLFAALRSPSTRGL